MEKLIEKLKSTSLITFILALLSTTWIIIDYFVLDTITEEGLSKFSLEWVLVIISFIAFIAFHISVFLLLFYSFRVIRKLKSNHKKENSSIQQTELNK